MARFNKNTSRVRTTIRKTLLLGGLEDYSIDQRRAMWPEAKPLKAKHIQNCKLVENQVKMLEHMPKGGVCAELGVLEGDFSALILEFTAPEKLHLVDIRSQSIDVAAERFSNEISQGTVEVHLGDSAEFINSKPDNYFDWIYVDGDHSNVGVKRDSDAIKPKLKPGGIIALNDYTFFDPSRFSKFGIVEAANEFCIDNDFELIFLALQGRMYNDIAIKAL